MNAPDANLLLYAYDISSPLHAPARAYLELALSGSELYGIPVLSLHAFVRISTSTVWRGNRLPMSTAVEIVESWIARRNVRVLHPGPRHWTILREILAEAQVSSKQFSDAAIAAIAVEHDATVHTHDRDFGRFLNVRWSDPLATGF